MEISQDDFLDFCIKKELCAKESFVKKLRNPQPDFFANENYAIYQKVYAFYAGIVDLNWSYFDDFLAEHSGCKWKIEALKKIHERYDSVLIDSSTDRSQKSKPFIYDIISNVSIKIRPTIHLILDGQKHLIQLSMSRSAKYSKKKIVYAMNLIGLAHNYSDPNAHFSFWDFSKPEEKRVISFDALDLQVVQFLKDKADELYQLDQQIPNTYKFPESDKEQDIAA